MVSLSKSFEDSGGGRAGSGLLCPCESTRSSLSLSHVLCEGCAGPPDPGYLLDEEVCEQDGEELNLAAGWTVML